MEASFLPRAAACLSILCGSLYLYNIVLYRLIFVSVYFAEERNLNKKFPPIVRAPERDGDFPDKWERKR